LSVRVLVVDDEDLMRAGLRSVLSSDAGLTVVGEAGTGRQAVERTRALRPDVVLMDVRMPDLDGISATRELLATAPDSRVLILTTFEQDDYIFGALAAGASGFLLKRTRPEELIAAVHTVALGDSGPPTACASSPRASATSWSSSPAGSATGRSRRRSSSRSRQSRPTSSASWASFSCATGSRP
jgi:DNA-binding NarL/FixJ family response regulator